MSRHASILLIAVALYAETAAALPVDLTRGTHVFFTGSEDQRTVEFSAEVGALDPRAELSLRLRLRCPSGGCDAWDRLGTFGVIRPSRDGRVEYLELMRFMTPYGVGGEWVADVSDFLPLFQGAVQFRVFIDTWVGPGSPYGSGWLVDAELEVRPGQASRRVVQVWPIFERTELPYGEPNAPAAQLSALVPRLRAGQSAKLRMTVTGHGQGNSENCAEFCPKTHGVTIAGATFSREIWRDDCAATVDPNQLGNYASPRAGWCPGDQVRPWVEDITTALGSPGADPVGIEYAAEPYANTCHPDATGCADCVFGTSCAFDGGLHTSPHFSVAGYVIVSE